MAVKRRDLCGADLIRLQLLLGEGRLLVAHGVRRIVPSQSCIPLETPPPPRQELHIQAEALHPAPRMMLLLLEEEWYTALMLSGAAGKI